MPPPMPPIMPAPGAAPGIPAGTCTGKKRCRVGCSGEETEVRQLRDGLAASDRGVGGLLTGPFV